MLLKYINLFYVYCWSGEKKDVVVHIRRDCAEKWWHLSHTDVSILFPDVHHGWLPSLKVKLTFQFIVNGFMSWVHNDSKWYLSFNNISVTGFILFCDISYGCRWMYLIDNLFLPPQKYRTILLFDLTRWNSVILWEIFYMNWISNISEKLVFRAPSSGGNSSLQMEWRIEI
jgi:hypothetical protein